MNTRSAIRWVHPIAFLVITFLAGCADHGIEPLAPDPSGNVVTILNSVFTITASWQPTSATVGLSVRGTIGYVAHAYPIDIVSYTLRYEYLSTEVSASSTTLPQYRPQSLDIRDDIQNFVPLAMKPLKAVEIKFHSRIDGKDSLFTMSVAVNTQCAVLRGCEPGISMLYTGTDLTLGSIIWAHNSQSFYFHVRRDFNEEICQCKLANGSIQELTLHNQSLAARDESPDGRYLLVSDNNAKPSNQYLLDLQSLDLKLLIPAQDSAIVTSAKFSPDGTQIAFTSEREVGGFYRPSMWLFTRADSAMRVLLSSPSGYSPTLTDWNTNNDLVYHSYGGDLNLVSPATLITQRISYAYMFYPSQLLSDHSSVAGILVSDIQSGGVAENHLALFDLNGKPLRQLTFAGEVIFDFAVSPDRSKVVFTTYRDNQQSLQLYMVSLSRVQTVTTSVRGAGHTN